MVMAVWCGFRLRLKIFLRRYGVAVLAALALQGIFAGVYAWFLLATPGFSRIGLHAAAFAGTAVFNFLSVIGALLLLFEPREGGADCGHIVDHWFIPPAKVQAFAQAGLARAPPWRLSPGQRAKGVRIIFISAGFVMVGQAVFKVCLPAVGPAYRFRLDPCPLLEMTVRPYPPKFRQRRVVRLAVPVPSAASAKAVADYQNALPLWLSEPRPKAEQGPPLLRRRMLARPRWCGRVRARMVFARRP